MRVGIDLRAVVDPAQRRAKAIEADRLGLWAVMIGGAPETVALEAAEIAVETTSIHLAIALHTASAHPHTQVPCANRSANPCAVDRVMVSSANAWATCSSRRNRWSQAA